MMPRILVPWPPVGEEPADGRAGDVIQAFEPGGSNRMPHEALRKFNLAKLRTILVSLFAGGPPNGHAQDVQFCHASETSSTPNTRSNRVALVELFQAAHDHYLSCSSAAASRSWTTLYCLPIASASKRNVVFRKP